MDFEDGFVIIPSNAVSAVDDLDSTTLLIIILLVLVLGGGGFPRQRPMVVSYEQKTLNQLQSVPVEGEAPSRGRSASSLTTFFTDKWFHPIRRDQQR